MQPPVSQAKRELKHPFLSGFLWTLPVNLLCGYLLVRLFQDGEMLALLFLSILGQLACWGWLAFVLLFFPNAPGVPEPPWQTPGHDLDEYGFRTNDGVANCRFNYLPERQFRTPDGYVMGIDPNTLFWTDGDLVFPANEQGMPTDADGKPLEGELIP